MGFFSEIGKNLSAAFSGIVTDIKVVTVGAPKPTPNPSGAFMPHPAQNGGTGTNTSTPDPYNYSWFLRLNKAEWQRSEEWLLRKMQSMLSEGKLTKGDYNSLISRRNELLRGEKYTLWEGVADSIQSNLEAAANSAGKGLGVGNGSAIMPALLIALIAMVIIRFFK